MLDPMCFLLPPLCELDVLPHHEWWRQSKRQLILGERVHEERL